MIEQIQLLLLGFAAIFDLVLLLILLERRSPQLDQWFAEERCSFPAMVAAELQRLGEGGWKGLYSVVSLLGFGLILWGYGLARQQPVLLPELRNCCSFLQFFYYNLQYYF